MWDDIRRVRYLNVVTTSRTVPLSIILLCCGTSQETYLTLHFDRLKVIKLEIATHFQMKTEECSRGLLHVYPQLKHGTSKQHYHVTGCFTQILGLPAAFGAGYFIPSPKLQTPRSSIPWSLWSTPSSTSSMLPSFNFIIMLCLYAFLLITTVCDFARRSL